MSRYDIDIGSIGEVQAYQQGRADAIEELFKIIEPYINDINTNEVWSHTDNEKQMFDWICAWKMSLYRDLEQLKEQTND